MTVEWPVDVKGFMSFFQMLGQGMPCYQVPPQSAWDDVSVCASKELTDLAVSNHEFKDCAGCKKAACICLYQVCMEKMSNSNAAMSAAVRNSKLLLSILIFDVLFTVWHSDGRAACGVGSLVLVVCWNSGSFCWTWTPLVSRVWLVPIRPCATPSASWHSPWELAGCCWIGPCLDCWELADEKKSASWSRWDVEGYFSTAEVLMEALYVYIHSCDYNQISQTSSQTKDLG